MTIKQHGGVFGRNPTFNNVEAESLTIAGNAVPDASTILVDGDIGSTVQGYDADTVKLDVVQTFTAEQTFNENIVMADGKGIDFSATSDTSASGASMSNELFDDYEEGTFTPVIEGTTTAGTGTYSKQDGHYTKIGDTVFFTIEIGQSNHTGTGNMKIIGLPFTSSGSSSRYSFAVVCRFLAFSDQLTAILGAGSAILEPQTISNGAAQAGVPMDTSFTFLAISGAYKV